VSAGAAAIADIAPVIHVLTNNAGVMLAPFGRTVDGFEMQFGTNHWETARTRFIPAGSPHRWPAT